MTGSVETAMSRRDRILLTAVAITPFVVYSLLAYFGYIGYLKLAVMGGVALAGAAGILVFPRLGLWMLLFYIYLGSLVPSVAAAMTPVMVAGTVLELVRGEKSRLTDALFWYASAFLLLIAIGSILFAQAPSLAFLELAKYGKILVLVYLIVQLVRTPEDLRRMMMMVFAGAVATVFAGLAIIALGVHPLNLSLVRGESAEYMVRFTGAHANPNLAAALMCSSVPLGIFLLKHATPRMRVVFVLGIVSLIVAIFATFSRSVVFAFSFVSLAVLIREARSRRAYIALATLLAIGVLSAPGLYWERVVGLRDAFETTTLDWSVYTRLLALQTAWDMFLDRPLTGVGIGNFFAASSHKLFVRMVVHNTYLEILVGMGIFGLMAFLTVILSGIRHSLTGMRHRWTHHPAWLRSASFYWALSGVSICMSAFFGSMPFRYFIWVPVAAGLVIGNLLREDRNARV